MPIVGIDGIKAAVDAVRKGEFACTITSDPFWQGGMGLSIGYHAAMKKFDPAKEPQEHREFYGQTVTIAKDNGRGILSRPTSTRSRPIDWND